MFSGKTDELIRRLRAAGRAGGDVLAVRPGIDVRESEPALVSHSGARHPAIRVGRASELPAAARGGDVVGVDEAQFFDPGIVSAVEELRAGGFRVIVAGLDCDFRRRPFPATRELAAVADSVTALTATCAVCGAAARFTQRLVHGRPAPPDDPVIRVGGRDLYEARCASCHRQAARPAGTSESPPWPLPSRSRLPTSPPTS